MYRVITLVDVFTGATDVDELLIKLNEYKTNGVKYILSYGYKDISIEKLIATISRYRYATPDLEEMLKVINYQIHS